MSITDKNYFQRRAQSGITLKEEASKRIDGAKNAEKALYEAAYDNTFKVQSTKSSRTLRQKNADLMNAMQEAADYFVASVVRQAVPFDLSNIGAQELVEQIRAVKDQYNEILNESTICTPVPTPNGLNLQVPDHVANFIGIGVQDAQAGVVADRLARNVLTVQGLSYIKDKTPISFAYNNVDTQCAVGSEAEACVDSPLKTSLVNLTAAFSGEVRKRLGTALREDAEKREYSDAVLLEGKEGVPLVKARRKLDRARKHSLLEEVFKTTKVLNESSGATEADYLNESVFVTAILETYNTLNCISKNMDDVAMTLYKKRKAFVK
jgi:hypothetical protein